MKKVTVFMGISITVSLILSLINLGVSQQMTFSIEDEKGDSSILDKVSTTIHLQAGNHDIPITIKDHKSSYKINKVEDSPSDMLFNSKNEERYNVPIVTPYEVSDALGPEEKIYDELLDNTSYVQRFKKAKLAYPLFFNGQQRMISTDLEFYGSEEVYVTQEHRMVEAYEEGLGSRQEEVVDYVFSGIDSDHYSGYARYDEEVRYFLPLTDKHIIGTPKLYKLNLSKKNGLSYETLAEMPEGRYYHKLSFMNNQLLVLSYDQQFVYVTSYDLEGTVLKENKLAFHEFFQIAKDGYGYTDVDKNDQYIMYTVSNEKVLIVDTNTMEMKVECMDTPENFGSNAYCTHHDFYYQDDILYVGSQCGDDSGKFIMLHAYQNKKQLYSGKVYLFRKSSNDYTIFNNITMYQTIFEK